MRITIDVVIQRWRDARASLVPMAGEILADHSGDITQMVREQAYAGYDGAGDRFPPYKMLGSGGRAYAQKKHDMNPVPGYGNPDYYLTGSFYNRMSVAFEGGNMRVDSDDEKRDYIISGTRFRKGAGLILFRLNPDNIGRLRKGVLQPGLVRRLSQITGTTYA